MNQVSGRISLQDPLQHKWFILALVTLQSKFNSLSDYDKEFVTRLSDGYEMVGREMSITVKQMNHLKQIAAEVEGGKYRDR